MKYGLLLLNEDINSSQLQILGNKRFSITVNTACQFNKNDKVLGYLLNSSKKIVLEYLVAENSTSTKLSLSKICEIAEGVTIEEHELLSIINKAKSLNQNLIELNEKDFANYEQKLFSLIGIEKSKVIVSTKPLPFPHNRIIFGAPGTGKSYQLDQDRKKYFDESHFERVTFHPNYSYAQFVGTYKPAMKKTETKEEITYEYTPGPFIRILEKALKSRQDAIKNNTKQENFLLIIEEINRANVAAVFGDVFQLLDRNSDNESEYKIAASEDLKKYLVSKGIDEETAANLYIPSNMYIWATMNSADQGVMPLDAAFKRRWNFEYISINDGEKEVEKYQIPMPTYDRSTKKYTTELVSWNLFRKALNNKLKTISSLNVNEDKLLGPFFISLKDLETAKDKPNDFIKLFKSKVLMYLFEDVCKMNPKALFSEIDIDARIHYSDVCEQFDKKGIGIFSLKENDLEEK